MISSSAYMEAIAKGLTKLSFPTCGLATYPGISPSRSDTGD
ncbi:MAG: hypothetical protein VX977_05355 [Pseudomonadota bacterium]|nr:hypothetical protein [Pseudomonadota bacterium]